MNKLRFVFSILVSLVVSHTVLAQADVHRPNIIGLSHLGLWVKDLDASRQFYKNYLGFDEPYSVCLLYTSPSPRDRTRSRMPSSA